MDSGEAAAISGVSQTGLSYINMWLQGQENDKQRAAALAAYERMRADALADREAMNNYNSPLQQMNRLRQAGLNPNLVYGTGAANTAAMARSSQANPPSTIAPKLDTNTISNAMQQYFSTKQAETNISNTQEQTRLAVKQGLLTDTEIANKVVQKDASQFALDQARELKDQTIKKANLENEERILGNKLKNQEIYLNLQKNDREKIASSRDLAKTMQDILESKERTKNIQLNGAQERELRQLDINLRKTGVMPHDPIYIRAVAKWYNQFKEGWKQQLGPKPKNLWPGIEW